LNLATVIDAHPDDRAALVSRGRTTTYGDLRAQVGALRGGLAGLGLETGDRVAIACANNWYFVASYLAVIGAGLVAVPLNPTSPAAELTRELGAVGARAAVVGPSAAASFAGVDRAGLPDLRTIILAGDAPDGGVPLDDLLASAPAPVVDRSEDDLAVLMFTSGTAGHSKAAMLTHGNLLANIEQMQRHPARRQQPADVSFGVLPFFHIFGLNVVLNLSLSAGSSVLCIERFDPTSALESVARWGVSIVTGPPTMWAAWANLPDADTGALRSVRVGASGAAKLPEDVYQRVLGRFGVAISEGYGLTEASPVVATSTGLAPRWGTIGVPLDGVAVRLVDADGDDVLIGDAGELWVKGPNVFPGYWEDGDATRAALTDDGWLRTGDVAVVDDDGLLWLVDRVKDLIIVSGFNVYPAEVEDVLIANPEVEAVAVVGVPHPYSGEAVKAYVVLADGAAEDEDKIIAWCEERLARYKCPDKVMFVDELPQGLGGKVLRRELR
jgi:long-chain acyl-CoA synthetase